MKRKDQNSDYPVLYSFRRCPYAIRARMAIAHSGIGVELREVVLRNKPREMLEISPKGTVPVFQLQDNTVIDESLEIMQWALSQQEENGWTDSASNSDIFSLIDCNDGEFKYFLDRYKYADRYPEHSQRFYRTKAEQFLAQLEQRLRNHTYLCSDHFSLADAAIFPFIRQFANVDLGWFETSEYQVVNNWLSHLLESALFLSIMEKYKPWSTGDPITFFPDPT